MSAPSASTVSTSTVSTRIEAFRQRLRELGYTEGQNIIVEYRYAEGGFYWLPDLAAELVRLNVDVIVAARGTQAFRAAKNATNTTPIVITGTPDPVAAGLVASLARSGGNITGVTNLGPELGGKRLELLKEAVPKIVRVAVLYDPANSPSVLQVKEVLPVATRALGLTVLSSKVRAAEGFERVFAALDKQRPDGVFVLGGPLMYANQERTIGFALKSRLSSAYNRKEDVDAGGLISYGADLADSSPSSNW